MDIKQLLEKQEQLDNHIMKEHKLPFIKLTKSVLATITELSEVANDEQSCFKYWKRNAAPKPTLLEEVADFTHFLASLSNRFKLKSEEIEQRGAIKFKDLDEHFIYMHHALSMVGIYGNATEKQKHVKELWSLFYGLILHLNFTKEQVFEAYLAKHETNYKRQRDRY